MDVKEIPKVFWYSASVSLLVVTFGFTYISYKSGSLKVQLFDIQLETEGNKVLAQSLKAQEETLRRLNEKVDQKRKELADMEDLLKKAVASTKQTSKGPRSPSATLDKIKAGYITQLVEKQKRLESFEASEKQLSLQLQQQWASYKQQEALQQQRQTQPISR